MTFHTSTLMNYVYCIVARSRLTDVATVAVIEWETLNSGETLIACCTEEFCTAAHIATR